VWQPALHWQVAGIVSFAVALAWLGLVALSHKGANERP
jgi:hypothetical protein